MNENRLLTRAARKRAFLHTPLYRAATVREWSVLSLSIASVLCSSSLLAAEKKLAQGDVSNDSVEVVATILDSEHLKQTFGSDFDGAYVVVEATLTPKAGKPLEIHVDDFLMRSEQTGDHTGPLVASQIAGSSSLVVTPSSGPGSGVGAQNTGGYGGFGGIMLGGGGATPVVTNKSEIKNTGKKDPVLDVLKRKILAEKTTTEPVTGLLFFPMEKEKTKHLVLIYTAKQDKLRIKFK